MRFLLLLCLLAHTVYAQSPTFVASATPTQLQVGETLVYKMTVGGDNVDAAVFTLPNFGKSLTLIDSEESVAYQISDGALKATKTRILRLRAIAEGFVQIPSAGLRIAGKTYKTEAIPIRIASSNGVPAVAQDGVRLEIKTDKKEVYVGEPVFVTLRLYRRIPFVGTPQFQPIEIPGALTEIIPVDDSVQVTVVSGERVYVTALQRLRIVPLSAGKLTLSPAVLAYQSNAFESLKTVSSAPYTIGVKALPEPPEGTTYSGAVGEFEWETDISAAVATQNTPLTLSFLIVGYGNLAPLSDFDMVTQTDFRIYRSGSEDLLKNPATYRQERKMVYSVVPQKVGDYVVPTFSWTYFSPKKNTYVTLSVPSRRVSVTPNVAQQSEDQQIRHIKTFSTKQKFGVRVIGILFAFPVLLIVAALVARLGRRLIKNNKTLVRKQWAHAKALKAIKDLRDASTEDSLLQAQRVLFTFLSDKLGGSFVGLTHPDIRTRLERAGVEPLLIVNTIDVLEKITFALYAPSRIDSESKSRLLDETESLLNQLRTIG